jgi:hypothetical protein
MVGEREIMVEVLEMIVAKQFRPLSLLLKEVVSLVLFSRFLVK